MLAELGGLGCLAATAVGEIIKIYSGKDHLVVYL